MEDLSMTTHVAEDDDGVIFLEIFHGIESRIIYEMSEFCIVEMFSLPRSVSVPSPPHNLFI